MKTYFLYLPALALALCISGCHAPREFRPVDDGKAVFWNRDTTESAALLHQIVEEYNAGGGALPIAPEHTGNYSEIFRKVSASIQAGRLPAMAVAYESMTAELIPTGAITPLDPFIADSEIGLTSAELEDFWPAYIETNTYRDFGGRMYSFPFAKSLLVLYFNRNVLHAAGIDAPPSTWDDFVAQSRAIRDKTGKAAYAISVDPSTISAMIYSMGGEVFRNGRPEFDGAPVLAVFELLEMLIEQGLAYQVAFGSFDDQTALASGEVAFTLRTSAGMGYMKINQPDLASWGVAPIPQADLARPATVLFGPNIQLFNTTEEQQRAAWRFARYFTSRDTTVRWALGTGYLPVRKSALDAPEVQAYWKEWEYNRVPYDCLAFARSEPNVVGWQEVRAAMEDAEIAVLSRMKTGREAALELQEKSERILARYRK